MDDNKVLFQGEMQLCRWSESSTNGAMVTMWVHPEDLEAFKLLKARTGKTPGQRLGVVMVAIGEDEAVVQHPPAPAPSPAPKPYHKPTIGDLARVAVIWCKSPVFQAWAANQLGDARERLDEADCKVYVLRESGAIAKYGDQASRKHLDTDPECGKAFLDRILYPFRDYLQKEGLEP